MKKSLSFLAALVMVICMLAVTAAAEGTLTIVTTTYPLYDIARSLCGELADIRYAPEDAQAQAEDADIVLCVGGEEDAWADVLPGVTVVKAMDNIELIEGDQDVLTIPINCILCASYLADALAGLDAANAAAYQANLSTYMDEMISMDNHIRETVKADMKVSCPDGSMAYFAKEYGVTFVQDAQDAVALSTFNTPSEDMLEIPYVTLLHSNLHALAGQAE